MILTAFEISCIPYILPVQGNLKTLELVETIFEKSKLANGEIEKEIDFTKEEIIFLNKIISILDSQETLNFKSLSLVRKIKGAK